MLKKLRKHIVNELWQRYYETHADMQLIKNKLQDLGIRELFLDHFAIIDLPGPHSGIPFLQQIFAALGYTAQGSDYLPDKQNDFLWMSEIDSTQHSAKDVLPQVVVADFRLAEMPKKVRDIISHYAQFAKPAPLSSIKKLLPAIMAGDFSAASHLQTQLLTYFQGRDWPLPNIAHFNTVREFNELLAWVLIFGRKPNHFTLSIHLLERFTSLENFCQFVQEKTSLVLNEEGGLIKGGKFAGIAQSSTRERLQKITLADGQIELPSHFVEFVWRYPLNASPTLWQDYFTGFIAKQANQVIKSLNAF